MVMGLGKRMGSKPSANVRFVPRTGPCGTEPVTSTSRPSGSFTGLDGVPESRRSFEVVLRRLLLLEGTSALGPASRPRTKTCFRTRTPQPDTVASAPKEPATRAIGTFNLHDALGDLESFGQPSLSCTQTERR